MLNSVKSLKRIFQCLCRHKHEIESGRTSSVGNDILGFDIHGNIVNDPNPHDGRLDWTKLCAEASKVQNYLFLKNSAFLNFRSSPSSTWRATRNT